MPFDISSPNIPIRRIYLVFINEFTPFITNIRAYLVYHTWHLVYRFIVSLGCGN